MVDFEEKKTIRAGKRLGVQWPTWMGDCFTSYSPRNCNNYAEGRWYEWVGLAKEILLDPMTKEIAPELYQAAQELPAIPEGPLTLSEEFIKERHANS